jgi:hypothetical protein
VEMVNWTADSWARGGQERVRAVSARCPRAPIFDPKLGHGWVRVDGPAVRGPVGSARWVLVFWPVCPVGQIRTRGVRLGRPAGDTLINRSGTVVSFGLPALNCQKAFHLSAAGPAVQANPIT